VAVAALMAGVLIVGAKAIGEVNRLPPLVHKFEHFFYYGSMAVLLACALGRRRMWLAVAVVSCVGLLDEWHQAYVPLRSSSALDWLVDTAGAAVAVWLCYRVLALRDRRLAGVRAR
jgi:VanZ family protein